MARTFRQTVKSGKSYLRFLSNESEKQHIKTAGIIG